VHGTYVRMCTCMRMDMDMRMRMRLCTCMRMHMHVHMRACVSCSMLEATEMATSAPG